MKILFVMRHAGYVRNFESTLRLLAERGHRVHVAFERPPRGWMGQSGGIVGALADELAGITQGTTPARGARGWARIATRLRMAIDYWRYLEPRYRGATKLRARAERRAPRPIRWLAERPIVRTPLGLALVGEILRGLEQAVPTDHRVTEFIRDQRPDVLLVTPLIEMGSPQTDYIREAKALGVPTGLCVASWDNLTNKGRVHDVPDLVTVWNKAMKREAVELHGVPDSQVVVTGAQTYDHWFAWQPSTDREEFCGRVGLAADRPFLLYLCSSSFITPEEAPFVREWIRQVRAWGGDRLQKVGILIRPHPQNAAQWRDFDLHDPLGVAVWPRLGSDPVDVQSKAEFYDSIYHSAAVVGVNTSAQIESAIVGRPVYTLLAPEFRDTQGGTLHFRHLTSVNGGLLHVATSFEEHLAQLEAALGPDGAADERNRRFVEAFVRPHGLDVRATPRLVEAIESAASGPARRSTPRPVWTVLLRPLLLPLVAYVGWHERCRKGAAKAGLGRRAARLWRRATWRRLLSRAVAFSRRRARAGLKRAKARLKWHSGALRPMRRLRRRADHMLRHAVLSAVRTILAVPAVRECADQYLLPALDSSTARLKIPPHGTGADGSVDVVSWGADAEGELGGRGVTARRGPARRASPRGRSLRGAISQRVVSALEVTRVRVAVELAGARHNGHGPSAT